VSGLTSNHFFVRQSKVQWPHALLEGEEHHHLSRVLRGRPGKRVWLLDERGVSYLAEVEEVGSAQTRLLILEQQEKYQDHLHLTLAQALIKTKNMDLVIQKATELGVDEIVPVAAARSVVKIGERKAAKLARWQKIAREAAKQSRRPAPPAILGPQPVAAVLEARPASKKLILCESQGKMLRDILEERPTGHDERAVPAVLLLIGPEGGWTKEEEQLALGQGYEAVNLGKCILRAETAALTAVALIVHFWNE
jgi:16S rRNA (uracil1498-N3)-methyltransferase